MKIVVHRDILLIYIHAVSLFAKSFIYNKVGITKTALTLASRGGGVSVVIISQ